MIEILETRIAPAGVVDVIVSGGSLTLKTVPAGDDGEDITITNTGTPGEYLIDPAVGTKLRFGGVELADGVAQTVTGVTKGMSIALGLGVDTLTMTGVTFAGAVKIDLGAGGNAFNAQNALLGPLSFKAGDGFEILVLTGATVAGAAKLELGPGGSSLNVAGLNVTGDLVAKAGAGNDTVFSTGGVATVVGGKFSVDLGPGTNSVSLGGPLTVGRDASFTSGNGNDTLSLNGGGDYIFGGSLVMKTGKGNDSANINTGGVLQIGRDFVVSSGGGNLPADDVGQGVLVSLGISIGGKVSFTSGLADFVGQTIQSSFRDTAIGGSVTFKAVGDEITQGLSAGRVLTVNGAVNIAATATTQAGQSVFATLESFVSNSSIKGPVSLTGGTAVTVAVPGDLRGGLTVKTSAVDLSPSVLIGNSGPGYSGRIFGAVKITTPGLATTINSVELKSTTFAGPVTILGGAGIDLLDVFDSTFFGALTVDSGAGGDSVEFETATGTTATTRLYGPVILKGGAGSDLFIFGGPLANDLLLATGLITVDGGADADTLLVDPSETVLLPVKRLNLP